MVKVIGVSLGILGFIAVLAALGLVLAWPVMMLWNYCLVGAVAGVSEIGWLQAWGLLLLFSILFKSVNSN
jgi:hypothetical protein